MGVAKSAGPEKLNLCIILKCVRIDLIKLVKTIPKECIFSIFVVCLVYLGQESCFSVRQKFA